MEIQLPPPRLQAGSSLCLLDKFLLFIFLSPVPSSSCPVLSRLFLSFSVLFVWVGTKTRTGQDFFFINFLCYFLLSPFFSPKRMGVLFAKKGWNRFGSTPIELPFAALLSPPSGGWGAYSCIRSCITTFAEYATGVPGPKMAATPAL